MTPPPDAHGSAEDELDPDEPRTPAWLTLVGVGLFIFAGVYLMTRPAAERANVEGASGGGDAGVKAEPAAAGAEAK